VKQSTPTLAFMTGGGVSIISAGDDGCDNVAKRSVATRIC
jgi:hypothetical protein